MKAEPWNVDQHRGERRNNPTTWRIPTAATFLTFRLLHCVGGATLGSGKGREMGLAWSIADILTLGNFAIAITAALIGYVIVEFLRSKF